MFRVFSCLTTEHDWRLVVLAAVICLLASIVAISLFHRAQSTQGRIRAIWVALGAITAGYGIWATHFIAMLAYEPGIRVGYDVFLTVLSLIVAIVVTAVGIGVALSNAFRWSAVLGGAIVGAGVAAMHYTGMSALELPGYVTWSRNLVLASIVFGVVLGSAALAVAKRHNDIKGTFLAAVLLTLAIVSLHFTAMAAVEIVLDPTRVLTRCRCRPVRSPSSSPASRPRSSACRWSLRSRIASRKISCGDRRSCSTPPCTTCPRAFACSTRTGALRSSTNVTRR